MPSSASASSGRPPISPQSVTGALCRAPAVTMRSSARSTGREIVIALRNARVVAIGRIHVLHQIVRSDRQKIGALGD